LISHFQLIIFLAGFSGNRNLEKAEMPDWKPFLTTGYHSQEKIQKLAQHPYAFSQRKRVFRIAICPRKNIEKGLDLIYP